MQGYFCDLNGKLVDNQNNYNINGDKASYRFLTPKRTTIVNGI